MNLWDAIDAHALNRVTVGKHIFILTSDPLQTIPEDFSVYHIVEKMRQQRPAMVQAKDQYLFVYLAVVELVRRTLGNKPQPPPKPDSVSASLHYDYSNTAAFCMCEFSNVADHTPSGKVHMHAQCFRLSYPA